MRAFNQTEIPLILLRKLLVAIYEEDIHPDLEYDFAVRFVKARKWLSGYAQKCTHIDRNNFRGKRTDKTDLVPVNGGYIYLRIPVYGLRLNANELAVKMYCMLCHELQHIEDYQVGDRPFESCDKKRRCAWNERPEEIRAEKAKERGLKVLRNSKKLKAICEDIAYYIGKKRKNRLNERG